MPDPGTSSATSTPTPAKPKRNTSPAVKVIAGVASLGLAGFIAVEGKVLWREFRELRAEEEEGRRKDVIGYRDIHPDINQATPPADWCHDEDDWTLLWAGWRGGEHSWFRVNRGEVHREELSRPFGQDAIRAIDHPIIEDRAGAIWARIPDDSPVSILMHAGTHRSYPMLVLEKVLVVNDVIGGTAVLITYNPFRREPEPPSLFDPVLDGRRITMGLSGYLLLGKPLLYDRGTTSFWVERAEGLVAIAGPHKGATLARLARLDRTTWSAWRDGHADGRVLVGSDRSKPRPSL